MNELPGEEILKEKDRLVREGYSQEEINRKIRESFQDSVGPAVEKARKRLDEVDNPLSNPISELMKAQAQGMINVENGPPAAAWQRLLALADLFGHNSAHVEPSVELQTKAGGTPLQGTWRELGGKPKWDYLLICCGGRVTDEEEAGTFLNSLGVRGKPEKAATAALTQGSGRRLLVFHPAFGPLLYAQTENNRKMFLLSTAFWPLKKEPEVIETGDFPKNKNPLDYLEELLTSQVKPEAVIASSKSKTEE